MLGSDLSRVNLAIGPEWRLHYYPYPARQQPWTLLAHNRLPSRYSGVYRDWSVVKFCATQEEALRRAKQ